MFIKFADIDWLFLCNSYPCVFFESLLEDVINQESHVYSWNLGKFTSFIFEIYINFPLKHVIISTNV